MIWEPDEEAWKNGYRHAVDYHEKYGNLDLQFAYVSPDGFKLGKWVQYQRKRAKNRSLREDRRSLLRLLGIH